MPKEKVYDVVELFDVQVSWDEHSVQVGIESHDGRSLAEHLTGEGETPADFTGLWGTYDRAALNRLIKALRRARDSAFGRDE